MEGDRREIKLREACVPNRFYSGGIEYFLDFIPNSEEIIVDAFDKAGRPLATGRVAPASISDGAKRIFAIKRSIL